MTMIIDLSKQSITDYFYESLQDIYRRHSIILQPETHMYVVNLAVRFINSEQLFIQNEDGHSLPTLAFLYRDALEAKTDRDRKNLIGTLGDTALFLAACFPNIWQRRGLNRDYFISMGESAFNTLSALDRSKQYPYPELAQQFEGISDCLGHCVFPKVHQH